MNADLGTGSAVVRDRSHPPSDAPIAVPGEVDGYPRTTGAGFVPPLGARLDPSGTVTFCVRSGRATRIEVCLFASALGGAEVLTRPLTQRQGTDLFSLTLPLPEARAMGVGEVLYYGYRAWGPNWPYDPAYQRGTAVGFLADVDAAGNRFNPNKLLLDPYALEVSHDPINQQHKDGAVYATGPSSRELDSGPWAPKGIVLPVGAPDHGVKPTRCLKDEVIYEVHVRGLTMNDPSVPAEVRGTYAGAALKVAYLQALGVTAVEFLPVQESNNDQNDLSPASAEDDYWGYQTYNFFAPDRRYAADKSPGGPTREFRRMVRAFHDHGIKVYMDVVYNHTGEGGPWGGDPNKINLWSFRGLDNAGYYELSGDRRYGYDNTGCDGNINAASGLVRDLVMDSLRYWKDTMGVDGFRFDLAAVLGNGQAQGGFRFDPGDPGCVLNRAVRELPVRPSQGGTGADLIAEPWAAVEGEHTYQAGRFPPGWAEWNDAYRDTFRSDQNLRGVRPVSLRQLKLRFSGSADRFGPSGRRPWHSINYIVAHDGFTLADLYRYDQKHNGDPAQGGSDGGTDDNRSWDQGGDLVQQRQAARNALAFLMLSAGVPMMTGGDEMCRTLDGNNNPYNQDNARNWLHWDGGGEPAGCTLFTRRLIQFRNAHPALRPQAFWAEQDGNGNGLKDVTWYLSDGTELGVAQLDDPAQPFLGYRIDGTECGDSAASVYVAYNRDPQPLTITLPGNLPGKRWYRVGDTAAWMEPLGNMVEPGREELLSAGTYTMAKRSVLILIED